nr:MAG TPA: hypothetical protein [Caudoviricetes sp.]
MLPLLIPLPPFFLSRLTGVFVVDKSYTYP